MLPVTLSCLDNLPSETQSFLSHENHSFAERHVSTGSDCGLRKLGSLMFRGGAGVSLGAAQAAGG